MPDVQMLVVVAPEEIVDDLVDVLIAQPWLSGFTLSRVSGYSSEHSKLNLREQVEGHRVFSRLEVVHQLSEQEALLAALRPACSSAVVRYWVLPVLSGGHL